MGIADRFDGPHRRYDALTDQWVLVSAGRTQRPWQGLEEDEADDARPAYDPTCYLCPGNPRALGDVNPDYATTFVFTNDFAALSPETPTERIGDGLLVAEGESGHLPGHLLLAAPRPHARRDGARRRSGRSSTSGRPRPPSSARTYRWVQVFENRGESMGASNPHPHGQIWAGTALPREAAREDATQRRHCDAHGERLLLDYARQETGGPRVVEENDEWLIVVPFWATWPFETLVIPRRPVERLPGLDDAQRDALAACLIRLLGRYDALFERPFPYSMGWHQAPFGGGDGETSGDGRTDHWQLHGHFYPPLLRATVRKFMVGYELLAETQRDLTAEEAAERLRAAEPDRTGS